MNTRSTVGSPSMQVFCLAVLLKSRQSNWPAFDGLQRLKTMNAITALRNKAVHIFSLALALAFASVCMALSAAAATVWTYAPITGEPLSSDFSVTVDPGTGPVNSHVYVAKIQEFVGYSTNLPKLGTASFTNFDLTGTATVVVTCTSCTSDITSALILPASAGITPTISGTTITFTVSQPGQLVVEAFTASNSNLPTTNSLQIFANPSQQLPSNLPTDQSDWGQILTGYYPAVGNTPAYNLLYYGPKTYTQYGTLLIPDHTIVYVDGGAAIYGYPLSSSCDANYVPPSYPCPPPCVLLPPCSTNQWLSSGCADTTGNSCYASGQQIFKLVGADITFYGRGIIDGSHLPRMNNDGIIWADGAPSLSFEGITLRDSGNWTFNLDHSNGTAAANTTIKNTKIFGWRINSDGVDIDASSYVTLSNSFIRTFDDLVAVKTLHTGSGATASNINVTGMVLWNEKSHAFTVGHEVYQDISDVVFSNSDIVADTGWDWLLSVDNAGAATVSNVTFDNIRIGQVEGLATITMPWSTGNTSAPNPGNVTNITFSNISAPTPPSTVPQPSCTASACTAGTPRPSNPPATLTAYSETYEINTVNFIDDVVGGSNLTSSQVIITDPTIPADVTDVTITP